MAYRPCGAKEGAALELVLGLGREKAWDGGALRGARGRVP